MSLTKHIVFSAFPAWGHTRPFCILAARLVKEHENVVVTMLIAPNFLDKAHREISAELQSEHFEVARQRIRVLSTIHSDSDNLFQLLGPLAETYASTYQTLVQEKSITCAMRSTVFDPVPVPTVVILDFFALPQARATREITGNSVPVMAWITGHASSIIRLFGPESLGGLGDLGAKIDAEAARLRVTPEEIGDKIFTRTDGKVVKIRGLPPMYDYEFFPQKAVFEGSVSSILRGCYSFLQECDGALVSSLYAFEQESLEEFKSWFSSWNKSVYVIGPLLPLGLGVTSPSSRGADDIDKFLEKMLAGRGEKSVLFMSFGTAFFPAVPEYLEEVIEAFIDKDIPFIFCFASPYAKLSDGLVEKVELSGLGMLIKWAPQQFILSHPATGWFLSHGGHNGVMESLACGVPFILWPFEADQPGAAAHLSENLNVAIELIEVRSGEHGLKPLYRNGRTARGTREAVGIEIREVLDTCRSHKGEQMRTNARGMKQRFAEAWDNDGLSRKELRAFLDEYV
ncbi:hypothetical protein CPB84DRAFT_213525 [Gymnopilus junonius]|uniref:Glycosyltransferase n=1 Tax=Gymnopilus junonius TaxID=109634 RepID=A0A9P5TSV2_GYMJU|nr:hypothetical protein CPB84DRAFT_213525 [Gymnopilus junonius]